MGFIFLAMLCFGFLLRWSCWLLVVGCWLLVVGCWLLVVGCWGYEEVILCGW
ncbi:intracellular growth attenuator family protein [Sinobacterium caligoides]|uniref:intracellular growth attenuator family protein n=1 Tax=Sinobacterium caligoides TaxID=933926 RepID=UPI0013C32E25|nr:intracellular growth attenuator family protein [Sinobacterium caligoides]